MIANARPRRSNGARAVSILCAALAFTSYGPTIASAYRLSTNKTVFQYGETVEIDYDTSGLRDDADFEMVDPYELLANARYSSRPSGRIPRKKSGKLQIPSTRFLDILNPSDRQRDAHRVFVRVVLRGTPEGETPPRPREIASAWILIVKEVAPVPGAIDIGGRNRIVLGERLTPRIDGIERLIADTKAPEGSPAGPWLELVRLGKVVPGNAVVPDRSMGTISLAANPARILVVAWEDQQARQSAPDRYRRETTLVYPEVGHYELRLLGPGKAVLDRVAFAVGPPERIGRLRLEPPTSQPYSYGAPPSVFFDVDPQWARAAWPGWLGNLQVLAQRLDPGRRVVKNSIHANYLQNAVEAGRPALDLRYTSGGLRPASYVASLQGLVMTPLRVREMRWLDVPFTLGGSYRTDWLPKPQEPPVAFGQVGLTLRPGNVVEVGTPMTIALAPPAGVDLTARRAWVEIGYAREVCGFGSRVFVAAEKELYQIGKLPASGDVRFKAPAIPDLFEARLYEQDSQGEPVLLAVTNFATVLSPRPNAIALADGPAIAIGKPIEVRITLPASHIIRDYKIHLYRSAEIAPGGALVGARWLAEAAVDPATGTAKLAPVFVPGRYEVRLTIGQQYVLGFSGEPWGFDRLQFDVVGPGLPPLPAAFAYRRADGPDDWPSPDDALRKASVWLRPISDCAPAAPPPKGDIVLVEWIGGAVDDPSDDSYRATERLFPGHPYVIEARFTEAPSAESFVVKTSSGAKVEVKRTADPRIYRSELIVFTPEPKP